MRIISINPETESIDSIKEKLRPFIENYYSATPRIPAGQVIYRARGNCDKKYHRPSDISYPIPNKNSKNQRANRKENAMFYGASHENATLFEAPPKRGEMIIVGSWELMKSPSLNKIGYSEDVFGDPHGNAPWKLAEGTPEQNNIQARALLSKLFTIDAKKAPYLYKLSIAVAELFTYSASIDGLVYPSVETVGLSENIALKPSFVDKHLKFKAAQYLRVDGITPPSSEHDHKIYNCKPIDKAEGLNRHGCIKWINENHVAQCNESQVIIREQDTDGNRKAYFKTIRAFEQLGGLDWFNSLSSADTI